MGVKLGLFNIMGRMQMKLKYVCEKGAGETYFGLRGKKY